MRFCKMCLNPFEATRRNKIYCSKICGQRYYEKHLRKQGVKKRWGKAEREKPIIWVCPNCGKKQELFFDPLHNHPAFNLVRCGCGYKVAD